MLLKQCAVRDAILAKGASVTLADLTAAFPNEDEATETKAAYERLIANFPINYEVNFGTSEEEIEKFLREEVASDDLRNKISESIEEVKKIINSIENKKEFLEFLSPREEEIFQNWLGHLSLVVASWLIALPTATATPIGSVRGTGTKGRGTWVVWLIEELILLQEAFLIC
ncbi:MAG: hypothetical protein MRECE_3c049 [Mycoplasmataceae bacterium CE_OT135]|nr:MAG: hypothetical protein MRECE_3c049 [Mycoplasmataceae bacterium CE_OT135]